MMKSGKLSNDSSQPLACELNEQGGKNFNRPLGFFCHFYLNKKNLTHLHLTRNTMLSEIYITIKKEAHIQT